VELANLKRDKSISKSQPMISGLMASDLYTMAVDTAYLEKSSGGALCVKISFVDRIGHKLNITEYVTSGDAKGNKNYFEKNGKKFYLPGFDIINNICLLAAGRELGDIIATKKTMNIQAWDWKTRSMQTAPKEVLSDLIGKEIMLGVVQRKVNKQRKTAEGKYVPTAEIRNENAVSAVFRASDGSLLEEIEAKTAPLYKDQWLATFKDKIIDKTVPVEEESAATAGVSFNETVDAEAVKAMFP